MCRFSALTVTVLVLASLSCCTLNSVHPQFLKAITNATNQASSLFDTTDASNVGLFTFVNGLLNSFIDNSIGVKEQYQVSPKADLALLTKKRN